MGECNRYFLKKFKQRFVVIGQLIAGFHETTLSSIDSKKKKKKKKAIKEKSKYQAKALKKVVGKGINFLEGGPGKVVDLTENTGCEIVNTHGKRNNRVQSIMKQAEFQKKVHQYIIKIFKAK